jgi:hypothetical protein
LALSTSSFRYYLLRDFEAFKGGIRTARFVDLSGIIEVKKYGHN